MVWETWNVERNMKGLSTEYLETKSWLFSFIDKIKRVVEKQRVEKQRVCEWTERVRGGEALLSQDPFRRP